MDGSYSPPSVGPTHIRAPPGGVMNRRTTTLLTGLTGLTGLAALAGLVGVLAGTWPASHAAAEVPHGVHPSPSHFTHGRVDNRCFPLKPGDRYVYRGKEDGAHS